MALLFILANIIDNSTAGIREIMNDPNATPLEKACKFAGIFISRGWMKVGVNFAVFAGTMSAGTGLALAAGLAPSAIESGPAGIAILTAALTLSYFANRLYDQLENAYRETQSIAYGTEIIQRLQSVSPVPEFRDQMVDLLNGSPVSNPMFLSNLNRSFQFIWSRFTGERSTELSSSVLWHFKKWVEANDLQRNWMLGHVQMEVLELEKWSKAKKESVQI